MLLAGGLTHLACAARRHDCAKVPHADSLMAPPRDLRLQEQDARDEGRAYLGTSDFFTVKEIVWVPAPATVTR